MPEMRSGDPVPPPFYTIAVRLWNAGRIELLNEYTETVFVPQVVKVYWHPQVETRLRASIQSITNFPPVETIYGGCTALQASATLETLAVKVAAFFPTSVNISSSTA